MMNLDDVRSELREKVLHHRSLGAIVDSDKFERLWEASDNTQRDVVTLYVQFGYKSKVLEWIKHHPSLDLGEHSLNYLRERGKILRIKNYSRLSKSELINTITKIEEKSK